MSLRVPALIAALFACAPLAAADAQRFDVWEYEVAGISLLTDEAVETAVYPFLGEGKSIDDVEGARGALEKALRDAGYQTALVSIPEQAVASGVVRLEVIEAPIERVRVVGSRYHSQERILAEAPSIREGAVPHFPAMQEDIARLNRMPGRRVTPILKAGRRPGTTDIDLNVDDRAPQGGAAELHNDHGPKTESLRASTSLRFDNLFQRLHGASLQFLTAPQDTSQVRAWTGSYLVPLSTPGGFLSFSATKSDSNVAVLDNTTAIGKGHSYALRWVVPLPGGESLAHGLTASVEYKSFTDRLALTQEAIDTPIRYMPFGLAYNAQRQSSAGTWNYGTGLAWGFRGIGSSEADFAGKRFLGRGNFLVWKWDVEHVRALGDWGSLALGADGQFASQPLVSNEQYFAGGANSVRGYLQAEELGDSAYRGKLEWRGPSLAGQWSQGEVRPLVFVEGARLVRKEPLPSEKDRATLSSAGVGLRLRALGQWSLSLDVGWPFKTTRSGTDVVTEARKPRLHFNTALTF